MRRCVGAPVVLLGVLGLASFGACGGEDSPTSAPAVRVGPVRAGYEGPAFPVPQEPEVDGRANVVVAQREDGATEYLPAGEPVDVVVAAAGGEDAVSIALEDGETATADSVDFWVMPAFVELKNLDVTVDGTATTLGDADVVYHRETSGLYDDPATPEFEGISRRSREFLACAEDTWSIGQQTFTVDLVEMGVAKRDREMIAHGIKGLEWGMARPLNDEAIHELSRDCDGQTSADYGYTHHSTQWLESMGRAVYLLASSEYAGEYRETIDALIDRIRTLATALAESENWDFWVSQIEQKESGEDYTHRTFMMAAGMGLASTLADDSDDATQWENKAATIVQRGLDNQWENGVNPEIGGYDVQYQAYGAWLAQVYNSTLEPGSDLQNDVEAMIDDALDWERGRVKENGQFDTTGSSRICAEVNWWSGTTAESFDPAEAVRAFLLWSQVTSDPDLADVAVKVAQAEKEYGNTCPIPPKPPDA